ncbi:MAG: hypothetical protein V1703_04865 [Candidatus Altiarchaeota archaeon]
MMARKKRKQKVKKGFKKFLKEKKGLFAALLLVLLVVLLKFTNQGSKEDNQIVPLTSIKVIHAADNAFWPGNDPALSHEFGSEGAYGIWTSGNGGTGYLVSGPQINLAPGSYKIVFEIKADGITNDSGLIGSVEVIQGGDLIAAKDLYDKDFDRFGGYKSFQLIMMSGKIMKDVEFKVRQLNTGVNVSVRRIMLTPGPTVWLGNDPALSHEIGKEGDVGTWTSGDGGTGYLVSGPHVNFAPGTYDISYTFVIDELPSDSQHIATIEVTNSRGQYLSAKLMGTDFNHGRTSNATIFKSFINRVSTNAPLNDVEFKIYYPNTTVKVVLKDITLLIR